MDVKQRDHFPRRVKDIALAKFRLIGKRQRGEREIRVLIARPCNCVHSGERTKGEKTRANRKAKFGEGYQ